MDQLWSLQGKKVVVTYRGAAYKGTLVSVDVADIILQTRESQLSLALAEISDIRADTGKTL